MRLRFSLRLLLILFTLTALLFGAGANFAWSIKQKAQRHKAAVARLQQFFFIGVQTDDDEDEAYFKSKTPWIEFARQWIEKDAYRASRGIFANEDFKRLSPGEQDEALNCIKDLYGIEVIYLGIDRLTVRFMQSLTPHTKTTKLTLFYDSAEPGAEKMLCHFPNLESLELFAPASDDAFISLPNPQKIKKLRIDASQLTEASSHAIAAMSELEEAVITGDLQTPVFLSALSRCEKLRSIELVNCSIRNQAAGGLAKLDQVDRLKIASRCDIPHNFFAQVAEMEQLHSLDMELEFIGPSSQIEPLVASKSLTTLIMKKIELHDETLEVLTGSNTLMEIGCRGDFSNASLSQFLKVDPFRELDTVNSDGMRIIYSMNQGGLTAQRPPPHVYVVNVGIAR